MLADLAFVCGVEQSHSYTHRIDEPKSTDKSFGVSGTYLQRSSHQSLDYPDYGVSEVQNKMIQVSYLHKLGYTGKGMRIGILDSGFKDLDSTEAFGSLWDNGQILDYWNFHENDDSVFDKGSHGTWVLSTIAADLPGQMIGTAPDASFYLYRTEVGEFERLVEEEYWVLAAERADSLGVDVINTSLGYYTFDSADAAFDHSYEQMDGNTTLITRAADVAASRGILVVVSAGNQGDNTWKYIGAPADGDSVLAIGAVDSETVRSNFSSFGPSFDGDVKPNVAAQGSATWLLSTSGNTAQGYGTSFSSPLIAGAAACLWQAFPEKGNMEIFQAIQRSGHQSLLPDDRLGFGIPNFGAAYKLLAGPPHVDDNEWVGAFPSPFSDEVTIWIEHPSISASDDFLPQLPSNLDADIVVRLEDVNGKKVFERLVKIDSGEFHSWTLNDISDLPSGVYILSAEGNDVSSSVKIVKR